MTFELRHFYKIHILIHFATSLIMLEIIYFLVTILFINFKQKDFYAIYIHIM